MKYTLRAYGITRDILGGRIHEVDLAEGAQVADLREKLYDGFPRLRALNSLLIAVNNEYAEENLQLGYNDDIALIPPVSGG